jgi:hypothetical protein
MHLLPELKHHAILRSLVVQSILVNFLRAINADLTIIFEWRYGFSRHLQIILVQEDSCMGEFTVEEQLYIHVHARAGCMFYSIVR